MLSKSQKALSNLPEASGQTLGENGRQGILPMENNCEFSTDTEKTASYLQQAQNHCFQGQWQEAIQACEQALTDCWYQLLSQQPDQGTPPQHVKLGDRLLKQDKVELAIACYRQAIKIEPSCIQAYQKLAEVLAKEEQWQESVHCYHMALDLSKAKVKTSDNSQPKKIVSIQTQNEQGINAYFTQGNQLRNQGKIDEAIKSYHKALSAQTNPGEIHTNLGGLYAKQHKWQQAVDHYRKALAFDPNLAIVYRNLARILEKTNQPEAATECWYRALNIDSSWATSQDYFSIGNALEEQKKLESAQLCYRQAIKLQPDLLKAYYHLGELLSQKGQVEEAINLYRLALTNNSPEAQLNYLLGKSLLAQKQWQAATEAFQEAISLQPDLWEAYYQLGEALHKQQIWAESETAYRRALEIYPENIKARRHFAQALLKQKRWQEAIQVSRATLEIDDSLPWAYIHLGNGLTAIGELVEASKCYQQAGKLRGWEACVTKDYQFTQDWFTNKIPVWERKLEPLVDVENLNVLEIGSYEGMSTCWLLDKVLTQDSATMTCIDIYFPPQFDQNIAKTGKKDKVTALMGDSHILLTTLAENTYDLVYIDGCHQADHVEQDARLCWDLVKAEGIVIFDDYEWQDPENPEERTKTGIDAFLKDVEGEFEIVHQGYHLIIQKKSLDNLED